MRLLLSYPVAFVNVLYIHFLLLLMSKYDVFFIYFFLGIFFKQAINVLRTEALFPDFLAVTEFIFIHICISRHLCTFSMMTEKMFLIVFQSSLPEFRSKALFTVLLFSYQVTGLAF